MVDASVVVAALVDSGAAGRWAESVLRFEDLTAPHLMLVEVANTLRRTALAGGISADTASLAHTDLLSLNVQLFDYVSLATRVWDLRGSLTAYDAWYVALAELLDAPLATLDARLARSAGPRCVFAMPPS